MELKLEKVKDLKDFESRYFRAVGNVPPYNIKITITKPSEEFGKHLEKLAKEQFEMVKNLNPLAGGINTENLKAEDVVIKQFWFPNYGHVTLED